MSNYKKNAENIPLREINTELKAKVVVYSLFENDDVVTEKDINYGNAEDRKWLGRITFWALTNHCSVETFALVDIDIPTMENN